MSDIQSKETIFLVQSQPVDVGLALMEWAAWKFLAVTTAVFSYNLFDSILSSNLTGNSLLFGRIAGVFLLYLIIDAGLTKLLRFVFRQNKKEMTPAMKAFHDFVLLLLVVKVVATMTTSLWAAPEVSEALTDKGKQDEYVAALLATDSLHRVRETEATTTLSKLEETKGKRLKDAKAEGARLVANAVATGNRWQRDSYAREGFGWLTNPTNPDASDKQFAQRIQAAQKKAGELLAAVDNKTNEAKSVLTGVQQDTAYARTSALLTELAKKEGTAYELRLQRRTRFFWLFDFLAAILGTMSTYLRTKRLQVAGKEEPAKNIPSTLSKAREKWHSDFINWLESLLGIDINGDGTIGGQAVGAVATTSHNQPVGNPTTHSPQPPTMGFTAIKNRGETPPPPVGENRGTPVATTSTAFPQPAQPTVSHNSHKVVTEVVEDLEGVVMELCNKFKKEWPARWRERVERGGDLSTMQTNFRNWHDLLNTYLDGDHKPLSPKAQSRVEEFRKAYREEILPTIPQQNQQP